MIRKKLERDYTKITFRLHSVQTFANEQDTRVINKPARTYFYSLFTNYSFLSLLPCLLARTFFLCLQLFYCNVLLDCSRNKVQLIVTNNWPLTPFPQCWRDRLFGKEGEKKQYQANILILQLHKKQRLESEDRSFFNTLKDK